MRNGVKKYLKEVRDLFPAYTNEEDVFYKKLENNIPKLFMKANL